MYELLSKKSQEYIQIFANCNGKTIQEAMQNALVKEVIKSIESGELEGRSDFGFRRI